jgi:hypothetical protein
MRNFAWWTVLALLVGAVGCGSESIVADGGVDGSRPDGGGGGTDGGPTPDAGPRDGGGGGGMDAMVERDGGSILPPVDAGNPFGDAGTLGAPAWVPITVLTAAGAMCDPLVPCGGDVVGTWDVTGACIEVPVPMDLMRCPGATVMASGRARGRVTFDTSVATRVAQYEVTADVFIPGLCAAFVGGCSMIEAQLRMATPDARCVTRASGDCDCAIRTLQSIDDTDVYTLEGNQIVSSTSGRRWSYCITDGSMRYQQTGGDDEPGIVELGRR